MAQGVRLWPFQGGLAAARTAEIYSAGLPPAHGDWMDCEMVEGAEVDRSPGIGDAIRSSRAEDPAGGVLVAILQGQPTSFCGREIGADRR